MKDRYKRLDNYKKSILITLLNTEDKKIELSPTSGNTIYLLQNNFIHQPQQVFGVETNNAFNLVYIPEPWLIDLFYSDPSLFRL